MRRKHVSLVLLIRLELDPTTLDSYCYQMRSLGSGSWPNPDPRYGRGVDAIDSALAAATLADEGKTALTDSPAESAPDLRSAPPSAPPPDPQTASTDEIARRRPRSRDLRPLRGLLPFVLRYRGHVVAAFLALVASTTVMLLVPMSVRIVIDQGFSADDAAAIDRSFATLIAVAALMGVTSSLRFFLVSWIGERVVTDLRAAVFDHVLSQSPAFFEESHTGEIQSRLTADTTLIKTVVGSTASIALRNAFTLVGAASMLIYTSPRLSAIVLLAIPALALPLIVFGRWVRRLARRSQDTLADTNVFAGEALSFIQTVQAFTHEPRDRARYREVVEIAFRAARDRLVARAGLTAIVIFVVFAFIAGLLWVGAQDVLSGTMTGGRLGQFVLYALFCATSMAALTEVWGEVQLAAGAAERLFELLAITPIIQAPADPCVLPDPIAGRVTFERVDFAYPTRPERSAISGLSFIVEPGETVAIVGPSGAGKSTVLRLLLRFYDPIAGAVHLDGLDLRRLDPAALRAQIAIVPQESAIFSDSLRENIRYGRPDATDAEVETAASIALVDEFAGRLSRGLETRLGENGMTLSGGQRQRVAIARAVLKNAPVLLLDEATSALDAHSEALVQKAIERLEAGRTTIVIAHRLATVRRADRILVIDDGQLVASGSHAELLTEGGLYADLARMQFGELSAAPEALISENEASVEIGYASTGIEGGAA
jgi:ATP-binding cassette subfamily B protein